MPRIQKPIEGKYSLVVDEEQQGQRIDNFLFTRLKGVPKSRIYKALRKGEVRVNKKRIKPDYRLQSGDNLRLPPLKISSSEKPNFMPSKLSDLIENSIIYEDKGLIILNKPAGIPVHGGSGISFGVIEVIRQSRTHDKNLELVHRLDRETSGCLIIAKKRSVLRELHQLLVHHKVVKKYLALVKGRCEFDETIIEAPLKKYEVQGKERLVKVHPEGKSARTHFKKLHYFKNMTLLLVTPTTGRTHQIRVHAAHMGHVIVGDNKYGGEFKSDELGLSNRLYLHAAEIGFDLLSGQSIGICSCIDPSWYSFMKTS